MIESGEFPMAISEAGVIAATALARPASGRIIAVADSTLYAELGSSIFCIGGREIGHGPLNAIAVPSVLAGWPELGIDAGQSLTVEPALLRFGNGLSLDLVGLCRWTPPAWPDRPEPVSLRKSIERLRGLTKDRLPPMGIAPIVLERSVGSGIQGAFARRATLAVAMLEDWLEGALSGDDGVAQIEGEAIGALVGLGPGLTPSGDDFLVGVALAMHALGRARLAAILARAVRATRPDATSAISRAHLDAALDGHAGETAHAVISALMAGDEEAYPALLERVDAIGHCSGWDTLAGITVALSAAGHHPR